MSEIHKIADILPDEAKTWAQKLHRKKDDIEIYRKSVVGQVEEYADDERTITARVSTNDRDRDGEIVEPKGIDLKAYRDNPVLMFGHNYSTPPIGRALWAKTDETGLICKFQFATTQFADDIYQLYKGGFMRAFSIGFIPLDFDTREKVHKKISLLEVSAVPVPANERALVMEAYAKGIVTSESLKRDLGLDESPVVTVATTVTDDTNGSDWITVTNPADAGEPVTSGYAQVVGDPLPLEAKADEPAPEPDLSVDELVGVVLSKLFDVEAAINERIDAIASQLVDIAVEVTRKDAAPVALEPEPAPAPEPEVKAADTATDVTAPVHVVEITEPTPEERAAREAASVFKDYITSGAFKSIVQKTIRDEVTLAIDRARGKVY